MRRSGLAALRPWMIVLAVCVLYLLVLAIHYHRGAEEFVWPTPSGSAGYDGQFTYYIALDPANAAPHLDVPAYRYQRILHPIAARILALGHEPLIPWAMLIINLAALAAGTAAMESLLAAERASRWYALVYGLFGGVFFAVRVNTGEPLAFGLAILAILAGQRQQKWAQAGLLALAALAKETTLFFAAAYIASALFDRRWRDAICVAVIGVGPFVFWQIVLTAWLGQPGIGSGGAMATPFEIIPFNGIWRLSSYGVGALIAFGLLPLLSVALPAVWALWRGLRDVLRRRLHPYVWIMVANAATIPFVPFSTYREPLGIARFAVGLVIGVLLYSALRRLRRPLSYSTFWVLVGARLLG